MAQSHALPVLLGTAAAKKHAPIIATKTAHALMANVFAQALHQFQLLVLIFLSSKPPLAPLVDFSTLLPTKLGY
jgi:hypothetical protein